MNVAVNVVVVFFGVDAIVVVAVVSVAAAVLVQNSTLHHPHVSSYPVDIWV